MNYVNQIFSDECIIIFKLGADTYFSKKKKSHCMYGVEWRN